MLHTQNSERIKISTRIMAGRAFLVKTPICVSYLKQINTWLTTGSQGALVYGPPRLGKTSATRWSLKMLSALIGSFPVVEVPVRDQTIASEKAFFQHLLKCIHHKHASTGSAGDKRDSLTEWLVTRAKKSTINAAVIFFDEAHLLKDDHYKWLLNIGNELDRNGCRLFCLLVGQSELESVKTRFIESGKEQIVGRFMVRELEFVGIRSEQELTFALAEFHKTIYPIENNILFPANFIPKAIEGGFELPSIGPALWSAFQNLWLGAGLGKTVTVPMHYFTSALIGILNSIVEYDSDNLEISHSLVIASVNASGYRESLLIRQATDTRFKKASRS